MVRFRPVPGKAKAASMCGSVEQQVVEAATDGWWWSGVCSDAVKPHLTVLHGDSLCRHRHSRPSTL